MRLVVLLAVILAAHGAEAASFDCQKAATVTEHAICASPALSSLDERAVTAYADTAQLLGLSDDPDYRDPVAGLLLKGHTDWSAARDRCAGASGCLMTQYLRRIAVLGFHPDGQSHAPADAFVGRFGTSIEPPREIVVMRAEGDAVLVRVLEAAVISSRDHAVIEGPWGT